jgi:nucleoside-diphosphate kinase
MQTTLCILKPDSVAARNTGPMLTEIERSGLEIVGLRKLRLSRGDAEKFYAVHQQRPFYGSLVEFMTSGPVVVAALRGEDAVQRWRDLMGATDPAKAAPGTLRKRFGTNIEHNGCHGSDAVETARQEIAFFFPEL